MRAALGLVLALPLLAGCLEDGPDAGDADGHYVYYSWGSTHKSCINGRCTYGSNGETFSLPLECDSQPTLSWDANSWVHGSVTARVKDHAGAQVATHTVSSDGKGSEVVAGEPGSWTFEGSTSNANGNMQMRLTCG